MSRKLFAVAFIASGSYAALQPQTGSSWSGPLAALAAAKARVVCAGKDCANAVLAPAIAAAIGARDPGAPPLSGALHEYFIAPAVKNLFGGGGAELPDLQNAAATREVDSSAAAPLAAEQVAAQEEASFDAIPTSTPDAVIVDAAVALAPAALGSDPKTTAPHSLQPSVPLTKEELLAQAQEFLGGSAKKIQKAARQHMSKRSEQNNERLQFSNKYEDASNAARLSDELTKGIQYQTNTFPGNPVAIAKIEQYSAQRKRLLAFAEKLHPSLIELAKKLNQASAATNAEIKKSTASITQLNEKLEGQQLEHSERFRLEHELAKASANLVKAQKAVLSSEEVERITVVLNDSLKPVMASSLKNLKVNEDKEGREAADEEARLASMKVRQFISPSTETLKREVQELAGRFNRERLIYDVSGNTIFNSHLFAKLGDAVSQYLEAHRERNQPISHADVRSLIADQITNAEDRDVADMVVGNIDFSGLGAPALAKNRANVDCDAKLKAANTDTAEKLAALRGELAAAKAQAAEAVAAAATELAAAKTQAAAELAAAKTQAAAELAAAKAQAAAANGQVDIAAGLEEVMKFDKAGSNESTEAALTAAVKAQKEAEEKGNKKMWIAIIISSVVFVLAGVGAFFFLRGRA